MSIVTRIRFGQPRNRGSPVPVAERSKARVCGRSLIGIAGSNPAGVVDVCVVCCTIKTMERARTVKTKKQVRQSYKDRTREGVQKKNSGDVKLCFEFFRLLGCYAA